jgi:hypothetical protein
VGNRLPLVGALIVLAVATIYFGSYARYGFAFDEGYLLDGVDKVMEGQLIYRDFYHTYAPGRFYLVAAAFEVFGRNLLVEHYVFAALEALKCMLAFLIVYEVTRSRIAFLAPLLVMIAPGPWHKVFFSSFGFLALYAVLVCFRRSRRALLVAGLVLGSCAVFRQDVAGFAAIGGLAGLAVHGITAHRPLRELGGKVLSLVAGALIAGGPVLVFFLVRGALGPMIHDLTVGGMLDNATNRLPYPGLTAHTPVNLRYLLYALPVKIAFYVPFVVYAGALVTVARAVAFRRWNPAMTALAVVTLVSLLAFNQSVWRSDLGHLLQSMQFVFLLVPIVLYSVFRGLYGRAATAWKALLLVLPPAIFVWASLGIVEASTNPRTASVFEREGLFAADVEYLGSIAVRAGNTTRLDLPRVPVYVRPQQARFFDALGRFLDTHTSPGDYVLAVPQLQMVYFFYDRKNPTRYAHYRRRLTPEEEDRYIEDIASRRTEYILLTEPYEGARTAGTRESFSRYAARVRDWILENYTEVGRLGSVRILKRKQ